jgi:putative ABC transport system permease protein
MQVGDRITLNLGLLGKDEWQVIGLYEPVFTGNFAGDTIYAPLDVLFDVARRHNQGTLLYVRTTDHSPAFVTQVTTNLKDAYEARKINIAASQTQADLRKTNEFQFSTVTSMLMGLSVIVAVVGGIALMGALSISVVERTKEIGVLRAIGARSFTILRIYLMEGILQGLLSVALAVPISFLTAGTVAALLGHAMFGATLDFAYNWSAVVTWLVIMLVISALATLLPARSATRISVRSSLAYT